MGASAQEADHPAAAIFGFRHVAEGLAAAQKNRGLRARKKLLIVRHMLSQQLGQLASLLPGILLGGLLLRPGR
jgi:hypothetical protein